MQRARSFSLRSSVRVGGKRGGGGAEGGGWDRKRRSVEGWGLVGSKEASTADAPEDPSDCRRAGMRWKLGVTEKLRTRTRCKIT